MTKHKILYINATSADFQIAQTTGKFRCIVGDTTEGREVAREGEYKASRKVQHFGQWSLDGLAENGLEDRDYTVRDEIRRAIWRHRVIWVDGGDVQSIEAYDFKVDPKMSFEEMKHVAWQTIDDVVTKLGGRPVVKDFVPTTWQRKAIEFIGESLEAGKQTFLMELAPRFGKTGTFLSLFQYSDAEVMVITNYVKTVNESFASAVRDFFANTMVAVDSRDEELTSKIQEARSQGKKVVITCSLHQSKKLDAVIDYLSTIDNRFVLVDEADFGTHRPAQAKRIEKLRYGVPLILTTGTDGDKARGTHQVDAFYSTTYFDMRVEAEAS